jgi:oligoendopeptidase F
MRTISAALTFFVFCAIASAASLSLESRWVAKEQKLAELYSQYWATQYRIDRGDSKLSNLQIQKRIHELETEPLFLSALKAAKFDDPVLRRRQQLFLQEAAVTRITADPALAKLVEVITRNESAMIYDVGGKKMPRSELNNLLGHEPNRDLRQQAWLAQEQVTAKTGANIRRAMKMRIELAQRSGESFPDLMLRFKGIRSRQQVFDWFEQIQRETDPDYQRLLGRIRADLKIDTVEPWDLDYYFSTLTAGFESRNSFPIGRNNKSGKSRRPWATTSTGCQLTQPLLRSPSAVAPIRSDSARR